MYVNPYFYRWRVKKYINLHNSEYMNGENMDDFFFPFYLSRFSNFSKVNKVYLYNNNYLSY